MKHLHKLKKHKYKTGTVIFHCVLPECHYKIESFLSLGKRSLCNICGEEFLLDEYSIKLVRPHCRNCGKQRVTDDEGKAHYVHKVRGTLAAVAESSTEELRKRLANAVVVHAEDDV
jgi:hypothetical protein